MASHFPPGHLPGGHLPEGHLPDAAGGGTPAFLDDIENISVSKDSGVLEFDLSTHFAFVSLYSIAPALPTGMSLDVNTGILTIDTALAAEGLSGPYVVSGDATVDSNEFSITVVADNSGGWLFIGRYEVELRRRRDRERERQEREEETAQIADTVDREIAQFMRAQEAIDDRKQELGRLAELAKQNADLEAARQYSERVAQRLEEALKKGTLRSIKQLDYELKRAREDEEAFMLAMLMMLE